MTINGRAKEAAPCHKSESTTVAETGVKKRCCSTLGAGAAAIIFKGWRHRVRTCLAAAVFVDAFLVTGKACVCQYALKPRSSVSARAYAATIP